MQPIRPPGQTIRNWSARADRDEDPRADGRNGQMPAQKDRLTDTQIRLLTAWLKGGARTAAFPGALTH